MQTYKIKLETSQNSRTILLNHLS